MLADHYRQLLTAYVDGELSTRQRRHVLRLLRRSAEARSLLHKMQQDAGRLRALPRPPLGQDLSWSVLRAIHERKLTPGPGRPAAATTASGLPAWAGFAAAAAVLLTVGVASYLLFSSLKRPDNGSLAQKQDQPSTTNPPDKPPPKKIADGGAPGRDHRKPVKPPHPPKDPLVKGEFVGPPRPYKPKPVKPRPDTSVALTGDVVKDKEMFSPPPRNVSHHPVVVKLQELKQEAKHKRLVAELKKDKAVRLELPCRDGTRALQRLRAVLKGRQMGLIIDQVAQVRLKNPRWKTHYALYVEDVTPEELAQLLRALGEEDHKGRGRKPPDVRFDGALVLSRFSDADHKALSTLMGMDPTRVPPPRPKGLKGITTPVGKATSAVNGQQVALADGGKAVPLPTPVKPAVRQPQRMVLVMAYNPVRPRPKSAEVRRFLHHRKPSRPGTVSVLLILRTASA